MQASTQERMMKLQITMKLANAREMLNWVGGALALITTGVAVAAIRKKPVPKVMTAPIFVLSFYSAFLYDLAYGTKINRIKRYQEEIEKDDRLWFNQNSRNDEKNER